LPAAAAQTEQIDYHRNVSFGAPGSHANGFAINADGSLTLASDGLHTGTYTDPHGGAVVPNHSARWTAPWRNLNFPFSELVSSWNANTPPGTWLQVEMKAKTATGHETKWYTMGIWASDTSTIHPTSVGAQGDADGTVAIDTFLSKDHPMVAYQLAATLFRRDGVIQSPTLRLLGAVASNAPDVNLKPSTPSTPSALVGQPGMVLDVPSLSQEVHAGEYPEFDGGGEAWCSPTSTSMVVQYWQRGPTQQQLDDLPPSSDPTAKQPSQDKQVDFAAMHIYDFHYQGTGNWPFNNAYAATFGLQAEVMQLHSLTEAEQFIAAGIPLVASMAFSGNQLPGFLLKSTDGHLLVIAGFQPNGDVVANDPAAVDDTQVRRVYPRQQFERAWLGATGGIVYVIHPTDTPLPQLSFVS
jgi:hypothetical protein